MQFRRGKRGRLSFPIFGKKGQICFGWLWGLIGDRKDIVTENLMNGCVKINKSALVRQCGCCWETIDRRLNPEKYKYKRKTRYILQS